MRTALRHWICLSKQISCCRQILAHTAVAVIDVMSRPADPTMQRYWWSCCMAAHNHPKISPSARVYPRWQNHSVAGLPCPRSHKGQMRNYAGTGFARGIGVGAAVNPPRLPGSLRTLFRSTAQVPELSISQVFQQAGPQRRSWVPHIQKCLPQLACIPASQSAAR